VISLDVDEWRSSPIEFKDYNGKPPFPM